MDRVEQILQRQRSLTELWDNMLKASCDKTAETGASGPTAALSGGGPVLNERALAVGQRGELFATIVLSDIYAALGERMEVVWVNEAGETGLPYDVEVRRRTDTGVERVATYEVKSHQDQPTADELYSPISPGELCHHRENPGKSAIILLWGLREDSTAPGMRIITDVEAERASKQAMVLLKQNVSTGNMDPRHHAIASIMRMEGLGLRGGSTGGGATT